MIVVTDMAGRYGDHDRLRIFNQSRTFARQSNAMGGK